MSENPIRIPIKDTPEGRLLVDLGLHVVEGDPKRLIPVVNGGLVECVDPRPGNLIVGLNEISRSAYPQGPKVMGGPVGIAAATAAREGKKVFTAADVGTAVLDLRARRLIAVVHGDDHAEPEELGCGAFLKLLKGEIDGLPQLRATPNEVRSQVQTKGGFYRRLQGKHVENSAHIVLRPGFTLQATQNGFPLDAWFMAQFNGSMEQTLRQHVQLIGLLRGTDVRTAVVYR